VLGERVWARREGLPRSWGDVVFSVNGGVVDEENEGSVWRR